MNRTTTPLACLLAGITLVSVPVFADPIGNTPTTATQQPPTSPSTEAGPPDQGDANFPVLPTTTTATPEAPAGLTDSGDKGFLDQDLMTGDWGGFRNTLKDDGVQFNPTYIGEVFGNPSGGVGHGVIYDGVLNLPLDLDLEKMSDGGVEDLKIHANAFWIAGDSLSTSFVGDFSNTSNIAAYNTVRLQELWLEKKFWDKRLSVKIGNIAIDTEFFQSASGALFINGTFGTPDLIANNLANPPVYPVASPGIRLQLQPLSNFYVQAGVFGSDNNSFQNTDNQNGTLFATAPGSGLLVMSEVGYLVNQSPNDRGLTGTYRLGSFVQTANYATWASQADASNGTGSLRSAGADYGIYGIMDQQIYANPEDQAISMFVRAGGAPSNVNFVDYYVEGGFNFKGFIPGRKDDVGGIAMARAHVSSDFSDSQVITGATTGRYTAETVIEATYKVQLAAWWSVQPDVQYIITPSGLEGSHNATVIGLRTNIAF